MKTNENEWKQMKMNENKWKWMKTNENEWKQMKMNENTFFLLFFLFFYFSKILLPTTIFFHFFLNFECFQYFSFAPKKRARNSLIFDFFPFDFFPLYIFRGFYPRIKNGLKKIGGEKKIFFIPFFLTNIDNI